MTKKWMRRKRSPEGIQRSWGAKRKRVKTNNILRIIKALKKMIKCWNYVKLRNGKMMKLGASEGATKKERVENM